MSIIIELTYAAPSIQLILPVAVNMGTTIRDLLNLAEVRAKFSMLDFDRMADVFPAVDYRIGVFGEVKDLGYVLVDGDRVEIYRPLRVDPKEARRKRALRQR